MIAVAPSSARLLRFGFATSAVALTLLFEGIALSRLVFGYGWIGWNGRVVEAPASFLVAPLLAMIFSALGALAQVAGNAILRLFTTPPDPVREPELESAT